MKRLYLILAILGAVLPYIFFFQYFSSEGINLVGFVSALLANGVVRGFAADLLFSSFVFWIYMIYQRNKGTGPNPLLFIFLNLAIGLSCALPAYLYAKENRESYSL
ncbi:MAG: DUF2834 domain-containing protein [Anaerolineales bacterium]|nr:DUF2834 domain-containing protein [Anaerolineales bacterium]